MQLQRLVATIAAAALTVQLAECRGQGPYGSTSIYSNYYQRNAGRSNPAVRFAGVDGGARVASRPQLSPSTSPARSIQPMGANKPFANIQRGPSISPYLSLDVRESATGVPVYYTLVKPQLDQIHNNRQLQAEYARMQQQLRSMAASGSAPAQADNGAPSTGHGAQFMNLGDYYPQFR